jgi:integrase
MAKTFFTWCVGRAIIDRSPCEGVKQPTREVPRDRVLSDDELARVLKAAREIGGPYAGIVELLALTAQRREEVAQMTWDELDLEKQVWTIPDTRTCSDASWKSAAFRRKILKREIRTVHQKHGASEYSLLIEELPSTQRCRGTARDQRPRRSDHRLHRIDGVLFQLPPAQARARRCP